MTPAPTPHSLFLGHGAPTLAVSDHPATDAMRVLGHRLARPRALIVVSPHRYASGFDVGAGARFTAWHDFRGFPPELYELRYAPPGDPDLAAEISAAIRAAGLPSQLSDDTRMSHGVQNVAVVSGTAKSAGITPITRQSRPSTLIVRPTSCGSAPRVCQKR